MLFRSVTDSAGCQAQDTVYVRYVSPTVIGISGLDSVYCIYSAPVTLRPSVPGGVFSGAGMSGTSFDPGAAGLGSHIITYDYTDSHGCNSTVSDSTLVDACLQVPESQLLEIMRVYPNPANTSLKVSLPVVRDGIFNILLTDLAGRQVLKEHAVITPGLNEITMDVSGFEAGVYVLSVSLDGSEKRNLRVVIQR